MFEFHVIINIIGETLSVLGALIIVWGILIASFEFLRKEVLHRTVIIKLNESIRLKLGSYLVLALEFFIAGDIVKTVITPTWESLGMLGAIVIIRTILSYFLTRDLKKI